mgnify:CR=1 FL=1
MRQQSFAQFSCQKLIESDAHVRICVKQLEQQ